MKIKSRIKTSQSRARNRLTPDCQVNLGPFNPDRDDPLCLCLFDRYSNSVAAKVPLSDDEWNALSMTANQREGSRTKFIADAIRAATPGIMETAHDRLSAIVEEALIVIELLSEEAWEGVDQENEARRRRGNGLASLAFGVSNGLEKEMPLAMQEFTRALRANSRNDQRRAA